MSDRDTHTGKRDMTLPERYTPLKADADTLRAMARKEADGSDTPDDIRGLYARTLLGAAIALERKQETERRVLENAVDRMGWPEIRAFQDEMAKGQSVYEDAGGYFMRGLRRLFGLPSPDYEVVSYQQAAQKMIDKALEDPRP